MSACASEPAPAVAYDPGALAFDGDAAHERLRRFVADFPDRDSGQPNNARAADFIDAELRARGLECARDRWSVINFSRELAFGDVSCKLPGASPREIVLVAHHDQSPETIEGADNDGSGIAILLGLADVFSSEASAGGPRPFTLVFLAADGEEWGMLGSRRYVQTHAEPQRIVAAISLDNLGKRFYDGLIVEPTGQFRGYAPTWLVATAEAATAAGAAAGAWAIDPRPPLQQVLDQAVPISFMDQGPFVGAGVPAIGLAGRVPGERVEIHWQTYHSPGDTMEQQSAASLGHAGRGAEAIVRQLEGMGEAGVDAARAAAGSGPYLRDAATGEVLRGAGLWAIFAAIVGLFVVGSARAAGGLSRVGVAWRRALPHALGLGLPLLLSVGLLYALVAAGLMLDFHLYPATNKDPELFHPRWPAVLSYVGGLALMLVGGRRLAARVQVRRGPPSFAARKSLALGLVAAAALYVAAINPFSLLFLFPALAWLGIGGRAGALGRGIDAVLLVVGGAVLYALIYFFGFVILRSGFGVLWYLMMMFAIGMISPLTAAAIVAALTGGLMLAIPPPRGG